MSSSTKTRASHQFGMPVRPILIGDGSSRRYARVPCISPLSKSQDTFVVPCVSAYGHAVVEVVDRSEGFDSLLAAFSLMPSHRVDFCTQLLHGPGAQPAKVPFVPIRTRLASLVILEARHDGSTVIVLDLPSGRYLVASLTHPRRMELARLLSSLEFAEFN